MTRVFGLTHLDFAEDVVQDTLCRALEVWPSQGIPHNPSAWLMRVARNRAIDTLLYRFKPSPIIALNRAIALGNALGAVAGLAELSQIPERAKLANYPFYPAAIGEFHLLAGQPAEAGKHFADALKLARSRSEIEFFARKCQECRQARKD